MNELPPEIRRLFVGVALFLGVGFIGISALLLTRSSIDEPLNESYGDRPNPEASAPTEPDSPPSSESPDIISSSPNGAAIDSAGLGEQNGEPDLDQVISNYRGEILRNRDAVVPRLNLGAALMQKGRIQEALAEYEQARRIDDSVPELHYNLGNAYSQTGRPADAIASYQQAIALRPDYANAYYNLGNSLLILERNAEAENAYREAIASDGQFAEAYGNLGILLTQRQAYDEARATLIQAQTLMQQQGKTAQLSQIESALRQLP
ncbi:MAG: tetratricopeptide repeat protein [Cyanobacteria bacterium P01_D01_bin.73]